jgi:hypothetical protein
MPPNTATVSEVERFVYLEGISDFIRSLTDVSGIDRDALGSDRPLEDLPLTDEELEFVPMELWRKVFIEGAGDTDDGEFTPEQHELDARSAAISSMVASRLAANPAYLAQVAAWWANRAQESVQKARVARLRAAGDDA